MYRLVGQEIFTKNVLHHRLFNNVLLADPTMNRYALILQLVVLSFLLGYFASNSQREYVYAIAILTAVFVTAAGYLFFVKHTKSDDRKQTKRTAASTLVTLFLLSALTDS
jgi:hypothetical protein